MNVVYFFLFVCAGTNVFSQKQFYPGFVLTESGEKKHGFISYDEVFNPKNVFFKAGSDSAVTAYNQSNLKGFLKVGNRDTVIYEKAYVTYGSRHMLGVGPRSTLKVVSDSGIVVNDTIFLKLLVGGNASLYTWQGVGSYYFFRTKGSKAIVELQYRIYLSGRFLGQTAYVQNSISTEYKKQLLEAMSGCNGLDKKIVSARYDRKDLREIFEAFNKCGNEKGSYYVNRGDKVYVSATFTGFAGFNSTWLSFKGAFNDLGNNKFKAGLGYTAGLGVRINFNKTSAGFGINAEAAVKGYKSSGDYSFYYTPYNNYKVKTDFNLLCLKAALLPEYTFGKANAHFAPYFNAGFVVGYIIKTIQNTQHVEGKVLLPINKDRAALDGLRKLELGGAVSVGLKIYRYAGLEVRYEYGNGISDRSVVRSYTNSLLLTARFFYK
ncbi:MAG TPA: porin family protein [Chitinophagales bacterium]|nr:porin family protein [Chitinophagales bacterium]